MSPNLKDIQDEYKLLRESLLRTFKQCITNFAH